MTRGSLVYDAPLLGDLMVNYGTPTSVTWPNTIRKCIFDVAVRS